jgi:glycosyltransferase involved in cell wall biosynthesis
MFTCTAIICVYNEADIIEYVLNHLHEQSIDVYIIDNWSTDGSDEIVKDYPNLIGFEKFPVDGPSQYYSWAPLLKRVEEVAYLSKASWCMHHDADEIRRSSRSGESLLDGFARTQLKGFNAVNFQVFHFLPTDDLYKEDPERHFKYYTTDHGDCNMRQVKSWRHTGHRVDLASTGGHFANFPGIAVSPEKFILKHYPLRTIEQSMRKVLQERIGRYDPVELAKHWHVQYQGLSKSQKWLHDPKTLQCWDK